MILPMRQQHLHSLYVGTSYSAFFRVHDFWGSISLSVASFEATEFSAACTQQSAYYAGKKTACQGLTRGKCLGYSEDGSSEEMFGELLVMQMRITSYKSKNKVVFESGISRLFFCLTWPHQLSFPHRRNSWPLQYPNPAAFHPTGLSDLEHLDTQLQGSKKGCVTMDSWWLLCQWKRFRCWVQCYEVGRRPGCRGGVGAISPGRLRFLRIPADPTTRSKRINRCGLQKKPWKLCLMDLQI